MAKSSATKRPARRQSKPQKDTVERVMHEFKHGELKTRGGRKVKNPKQAIAIGLSEAGASNRQSPSDNRRTRERTKRKERYGQTGRAAAEGRRNDPTANASRDTRAALYAEARRRDIAGRSRMSRDELLRALRRR
ncbi:DUF6496 domain-containing protein [Rhodoplanes roseus]|uniref:Uncharacterized protein n=1 Tax=Rhodoplanes roseus TaxID=29409 RepID=A0A327KVC7_9BRAD|nr:DUF6496 domain-containing protein [Rhodoplanes roseus]RAI41465.1 hypothetical protein CH341_21645 [Rhodoplanes roseus]